MTGRVKKFGETLRFRVASAKRQNQYPYPSFHFFLPSTPLPSFLNQLYLPCGGFERVGEARFHQFPLSRETEFYGSPSVLREEESKKSGSG